MSRNVFSVLLVTALLAAPLAAQAQAKAEHISTKVFYGDLDLSKSAGMQTLRGRLKAASLQVCGTSRGGLRVGTTNQAQCSQDAMSNALTAIGKAQNRLVADNSERLAQ
jgi:UrcA family protein